MRIAVFRGRKQHLVIRDIFLTKQRKAGWRVTRINLERQSIIINPKKVRRLMKKSELITQVRRRNPYRALAKATQEHRTAPNVHQREFDRKVPYQTFGTDITYLYDGAGQRSYMSIIRDMASGEIVAHHVSPWLGLDLSPWR